MCSGFRLSATRADVPGRPLVNPGFDKLNLPQADIEAIVRAFCGRSASAWNTPQTAAFRYVPIYSRGACRWERGHAADRLATNGPVQFLDRKEGRPHRL